MYSVSSAYGFLHEDVDGDPDKVWELIWSLKVPPKIKSFLWCATMNIIPTCDNLSWKQVLIDSTCLVCRGHAESVCRLFVDCYFAKN